jgi:hypothetical protein
VPSSRTSLTDMKRSVLLLLSALVVSARADERQALIE